MSGPWDRYQSDAPGPWAKYQGEPEKLSRAQINAQILNDPITQGALNPAEGMNAGQRFAAGAGKFVSDTGKGIAQMTPWGPSRKEMDESQDRDVSLMASPAGFIGNIGGGAAGMVPLGMIPGANTVAGTTLMGGLMGATQPVGQQDSRLLNTALGAVVGGGMKVGLDKLGTALSSKVSDQASDAAANASRNSLKDTVLKESLEAGYTTPRSSSGGGWFSRRLESIGGKAATAQEATVRNQETTNALARKSLGFADDSPITEASLASLRNKAATPYREVAALDPAVAADLEALKESRHQATAYFKHYEVSADPKSLAEARKQDGLAKRLEGYIEDAAKNAGKTDLVQQLREARQLIAKSYDVERALNVATGDVSASVIGRMLDKGKMLTGELATIAKFAQAFPQYAKDAVRVPTPGVSKSEALSAALLGSVGGWPAAALPLLSGPARAISLSSIGRGGMPNYRSSLSTRLASDVVNNPMIKNALPLGAVPSVLGVAE